MSDSVNDRLVEEAHTYMEFYTNTMLGEEIEAALKRHDLERLRELVKEAQNQDFEENYRPL